jgi:peroxiredoxin/uncharacterized membrane protein YphA (DoxX/SURF4 family)
VAREVVALLLAGVLLVAGGAKLFDLAGTRRSVRELGFPAVLGRPVAIVLPLVELALAAGLVVETTSRVAAAAAAGLLVAFAVVIGINAARGRSVDCGCFGPLHSSRTGYSAALRNAGLALLGVGVAATPPVPIGWVEFGTAVAVVALAVQGTISVSLLRRYGRALQRIEELERAGGRPPRLEVGDPAPRFVLPSFDNGQVSLDALLAPKRPLLLVFADSRCGPCHALMPKVSEWQHELRDRLTVAVVWQGDLESTTSVATENALRNIVHDPSREIAELYGSWATPSAVLIGPDGQIVRSPGAGAEAIEQTVQSAVETHPAGREERRTRPRAAAAGAAGVAAMVAGAAWDAPSAHSQSNDPELQAIDAALIAAGPRLVAAAEKSARAVRSQATLIGKGLRDKQAAARRALNAERREVLKLRAAVAKLSATSPEAQAVKTLVDKSLGLLARSVEKRAQSIGARPTVAARLVEEAQKLFLDSVGLGVTAGKRLGHA